MTLPTGFRFMANGDIYGRRGKKIKGSPDKQGYLRTGASEDGQQKSYSFHRLICEAFHGPPPFENAQARHLDDNKLNNAASNLAWGTNKDNQGDKVRNGRQAKGESAGRAKLTWDQVREIRARYASGDVSQRRLAEDYGVNHSSLGCITRGQTWKEDDLHKEIVQSDG